MHRRVIDVLITVLNFRIGSGEDDFFNSIHLSVHKGLEVGCDEIVTDFP